MIQSIVYNFGGLLPLGKISQVSAHLLLLPDYHTAFTIFNTTHIEVLLVLMNISNKKLHGKGQ